jgi:glycosyltransferase involved in cell wall biosynthesis
MTPSLSRRNPAASHPPWVLVSAGFHSLGGQSKANAAVAEYLLRRGHPVHLVGHDFAECFRDRPGCVVHEVRRPLGADFLGYFRLRRIGRAAARSLCEVRPDARVLVNGGCCDWADVNWVHYVHNAWQPRCEAAPPWFRLKNAIAGTLARRHERQALRTARVVIANSELTRRDLIERLSPDADRVHNIYLGCNEEWRPARPAERAAARAWLGQPEGRPLVVFVGGFGHDERKGFDTLWAAWGRLCARLDWDADLAAAGGGGRAAWWQDRIAHDGLASRVRWLGFTDRIFDLLAAADLLVSPVRYEPYGLNVQEAICRGVPALVSARAGAAEQYTPELAAMILPDPEDADDLARRLLQWRADVPGWRERFLPLSESFRAYSWEQMAARIVALAENSVHSAAVAAAPCLA